MIEAYNNLLNESKSKFENPGAWTNGQWQVLLNIGMSGIIIFTVFQNYFPMD
jgi:hypothetical protein